MGFVLLRHGRFLWILLFCLSFLQCKGVGIKIVADEILPQCFLCQFCSGPSQGCALFGGSLEHCANSFADFTGGFEVVGIRPMDDAYAVLDFAVVSQHFVYPLSEAESGLDANFNIKNIAAAAITTPTAPPIFMIDS